MIASRFSVGQFHPLVYVGLRFLLASVVFIGIYMFSSRKWPSDVHLWKHAVLLGVLGTAVPMFSMVSSLQYQSSGVTSVLITIAPAITVVMAHFALPDETLNWQKVLGVALALSGGLILVLRGESGLQDVGRANPLGYLLVLIGILCASASTVYARKFMRDMDSFDVSGIRMYTAAVVLVPVMALFTGVDLENVDASGYLALLYATFAGTITGMLVSFVVIQRYGATASAMVAYVIPVVAMIAGALILGEQITVGMIVGLVLIAAGITQITRSTPQVIY